MTSDSLIGKTIGTYEVLEKIGQGGMAEVYKGLQPALKRYVAIKILGRDLQEDQQLSQRFQREAQTIAQLRHPNIINIHDFGAYEGGHYLIMEYIDGTDLRAEMDRRRAAGQSFTAEEILHLLGQVADALDYAHERNVIHRDVKPGNILLSQEGNAILSDFGLAMLRNRLSQVTSGNTFGTPEYIAPEQAMDSRAAVPQSDIYSLGGVIYEMVTGHLPFDAESPLSLALKHVSEDPRPPRQYAPHLPAGVEAVILKALAKDPTHRYTSARAMIDALRAAWVEDTPTQVALPRIPGRQPPPPPQYPPASPPAHAEAPRKRWGMLYAGLALLALLLVGFLLGRPGGPLAGLFAAASSTPSPTATVPRTVAASSTPTATVTPQGSAGVLTVTPHPTSTPTATPSAAPTATPARTPSPTPTPTLAPGAALTRTTDGMVIRFVPGGPFLMGALEDDPDADRDELPQHGVTLSPYWMDETEVTTDMYKQCVEAGACEAPLTRTAYDNPARGDHPITYISWDQAAAYCAWVGQETGWDVRLPTEAQWEKAASWDPATGQHRTYPWGDTLDTDRLRLGSATSPVGSSPQGASAYGILDLAGNVWEWVNDWYNKDYYSVSPPNDPTGPTTGTYRVMRGGAYDSTANFTAQLRTTHRETGRPESSTASPAKGPNLGFRCVVNSEQLP